MSKKITNFAKLPKRKVTVDELLECDDINDVITDLHEKKNDIKEYIFIWTDQEDIIRWNYRSDIARALLILERFKENILSED